MKRSRRVEVEIVDELDVLIRGVGHTGNDGRWHSGARGSCKRCKTEPVVERVSIEESEEALKEQRRREYRDSAELERIERARQRQLEAEFNELLRRKAGRV